MDNPRVDLPSRIAFRPIIAGVLLTVAMMLFLSSSIRNFFVANGAEKVSVREVTVWFMMTSVWIVSVFSGSVLATMASRSVEIKDGVIQGLTVWAASFLGLGVLISVRAAGYQPILELDDVSDFLVLRDFVGELSALGMGVLGGIIGSRWERHGFLRKSMPHEERRVPVGNALTNPS